MARSSSTVIRTSSICLVFLPEYDKKYDVTSSVCYDEKMRYDITGASEGLPSLIVLLLLQQHGYELRIMNQMMYLNPPVEEAQQNLLQELFSWEAILLSLPRIQHSRYQVSSYYIR